MDYVQISDLNQKRCQWQSFIQLCQLCDKAEEKIIDGLYHCSSARQTRVSGALDIQSDNISGTLTQQIEFFHKNLTETVGHSTNTM